MKASLADEVHSRPDGKLSECTSSLQSEFEYSPDDTVDVVGWTAQAKGLSLGVCCELTFDPLAEGRQTEKKQEGGNLKALNIHRATTKPCCNVPHLLCFLLLCFLLLLVWVNMRSHEEFTNRAISLQDIDFLPRTTTSVSFENCQSKEWLKIGEMLASFDSLVTV